MNSYLVKEIDQFEKLKNSAEFQSLQSDPTNGELFTLRANIRTSKDAMVFLFISTFFNIWQTDNLIRIIAQYCYRYSYNGQWRIVQEFLEAELQSPEDFIKLYCKIYGPHDFYGNFLLNSVLYKKKRLILEYPKINKKPVKVPIRRRGYNDKGTLRINSDKHGQRPYTEKEDRRKLVFHPLLRENFLQIEECASKPHLQKGGNSE